MGHWPNIYITNPNIYILAVKPGHAQKVQEVFAKREIDAAIVGKVTSSPVVNIINGVGKRVLFDFQEVEIIGISYREAEL